MYINDERIKLVLALFIGILVGLYINDANGFTNNTTIIKEEPNFTANHVVGIKYQYDLVYLFFDVDDSNTTPEHVISDISVLLNRSNIEYTNIEKTEKGFYRVDLKKNIYNNEDDYRMSIEQYHNILNSNITEMLLDNTWSSGAMRFVFEGKVHYLRP